MSIRWITDEGILASTYENSHVNLIINYEINVSYGNSHRISMISNNLPNTLSSLIQDGYITISGTLPSVINTEKYYTTVRIEEIDSYGKTVDLSERYFEIECLASPVSWDDEQTSFDVLEYTDINEQLKLKNPNGTEVFKKISGNLPSEVVIYPNGLISGPVYSTDIENSPYTFTVEVQENGETIESLGTKTFTLNVVMASGNSKPMWITESGSIGSLNNGFSSEISVLAFDIGSSGTISYVLNEYLENGEISRLPTGLKLNSLTGKIEGILNTSVIDDWKFSITAQKYYADTYISSDPREFIITTNPIQNEHKIIWETDGILELGSYSIGSNILCNIPIPTVNDGSEIKFSYVSGNLPKNLTIDTNGIISGILEIQDIGDYDFDIKATTPYTHSIKRCRIKVIKGLGKNAIKTYLRLNLEYKDQYNEIKTQLNSSKLYKQNIPTFVTSSFPTIDVATLSCFDREVLSYILDFGNPEIIRFGHTTSKLFSQVDNKGNVLEKYEVFYKEIDESTYDWKGNIYNISNYEDFNNDIYDMDANALQNNILEDGSSVLVDNSVDPRVIYNVFNFRNVRDKLSQKIYVYKKEGTYEYDFGSQEIITDNKNSYNKETIVNPWCFDRNKNTSIVLSKLEEGKEMVLPLITDDDIIQEGNNYYIRFLDSNVEPLPIWKRDEAKQWHSNTFYNENDIILHNSLYYLCLQAFTTKATFEYDRNVLKQLTNDEMLSLLNKSFYPTLDIGYYEANTNKKHYNDLIERENNGDYWYRKDFLFYDLICEPLYNTDIDQFSIPFVQMDTILKSFEHSDLLKTLKINCSTPNAIISIKSDSQHVSKNNEIEVPYGTKIEYSISKPKHVTVSNAHRLFNDEILNIELKKYVRVYFDINPSDSIITIKGYTPHKQDNLVYIDATEGDIIEYTIVHDGYVTQSDKIVAQGIIEKETFFEQMISINMVEYFTFTIIPSPSDATVILDAIGYNQIGNSITIPDGTQVSWSVIKTGYKTKSGKEPVGLNKRLPVSLEDNICTFTVNPTPTDCKVVLQGATQIGEQIDNSIIMEKGGAIHYKVSKDGYGSIENTITSVSRDTTIDVKCKKYVTLTINSIPNDSSVYLISGNHKQNGNSITVLEGEVIYYTVERFGYISKTGSIAIVKDTEINVSLIDQQFFVPETFDTDGFIDESGTDYFALQ